MHLEDDNASELAMYHPVLDSGKAIRGRKPSKAEVAWLLAGV